VSAKRSTSATRRPKATRPRSDFSAALVKRRLRVHAIPLADDDGKRKYTFTAANLGKGIARANEVLKQASIELEFDPSHDWDPRNDTALNNLANGSGNWWVRGNEVAARIPGKIVIFFRHGAGSSPVGWGHAYPPDTGQSVPPSVTLPTANVNYVALPNSRNWDTPDNGNFIAHEVSHYLGLFHTHPGWGTSTIYSGTVTTAADAERRVVEYVAANGGTVGALDGDRLSATSPDCCRNLYDLRNLSHTSSGPASVSVSGTVGGKAYSFTLTPPRDNVMSYFFWGAPQHLTPAQAQVIHSTLAHDRRRILIEPPCSPDFHGLDASRFQLCFDYWVNRGLWPHTLSANGLGAKTIMAGSFQPGSNRPVRHLVSDAAYQQAFEQLRGQGFRPGRVTATTASGGVRYTAIWTPVDGQFEARHGLTLPQFDAMWHDLRQQGFLHVDLNVYATSAGVRAAAVWVKKPFQDYACYYGMTGPVYNQRFKDFWKLGLRVTCFCAYRDGSSYRFAAIWEKLPGAWGHWFGLSAAEYQAKYDEMAKTGHRLHQVQSYGQWYSGIWTKP
jgi:hypothetical protein